MLRMPAPLCAFSKLHMRASILQFPPLGTNPIGVDFLADILTRALSFVAIIVLGYILRRIHFFSAEHFGLISRIVMNITLPCAVIVNFSQMELKASLLAIIGIGVLCNLITAGIGYLSAPKRRMQEKAFNMINLSGYNIGTFTMPYAQNFLGAEGVVCTCLFDVGNALLCTGGTYAIVSGMLNHEKRGGFLSSMKALLRSVPIWTYLIMLTLTAFHLQLPAPILTFAGLISPANGFLAMLAIGISIDLHFEKSQLFSILKLTGIRLAISAALSVAFFYLLPFSFSVRQTLAIIVFAPVSVLCPVFTKHIDGDVACAGTFNSLSIALSIFIMTTLFVLMNGAF